MSVNIPVIQVGTGNQIKVIEPVLLVAIDPSGNPIAVQATADGEVKITAGTPPTPDPVSYTYTVTYGPDTGYSYRLDGEYFIVTNGDTDPWGIVLGWDGSGYDLPQPPGTLNYVIADPGEASDSSFSNRIQNIVNVINANTSSLGYTATFITGNTTTGSFRITPTNSVVRTAPTASVGSWTES